MKRSKWTLLSAGVALVWVASSAPAQVQTIDVVRAAQAGLVNKIRVDQIAQANPQAAPPAAQSPMVRPPEPASGANATTSPTNPDNMPIKRPDKPTHDKMSRQPPASGANAK
jgi:uncharacterized iron-regulated membrane protein